MIAALWRYPVKSLRAEPLRTARIAADGVEGDRTAALVVETPTHARAGKPFRGKESRFLHLTSDPETAASYAAEARATVTLSRAQPRWFDDRPVSVLFDLWVRDVEALVGAPLDPQRWRPNLYVHAAPGFTQRENDLTGATLRAGTAVLRVTGPTRRCVATTWDVATGDPFPEVLGVVARERDAIVGVYCEVVAIGDVAVGDALDVIVAPATAAMSTP